METYTERLNRWTREARKDAFIGENGVFPGTYGKPLAPYIPAPKWKSAGGVILAGHDPRSIRTVYMILPSNNFNGGYYTFPKGKVDLGESPEQAAAREVEEETGIRAHHIGGSYLGEGDGTMSTTRYYLMVHRETTPWGPDFETSDVRPVRIEECIRYLREHKRERDLRVAELALARIEEIEATLGWK